MTGLQRSLVQLEDLKFTELLDAIAAKTPTPGGGAVASMTLAMATALAQMVVNYSIGKKSLASHDALHQRTLRELQLVRFDALKLAEQDAKAYATLNELLKLKEGDPRRQRELPKAVADAIDAPMTVLRHATRSLELLHELCGKTSAMLNSDLAIAALLTDAAAQAAAWNVRINLPLIADTTRANDLAAATDREVAAAAERAAQVRQSISP